MTLHAFLWVVVVFCVIALPFLGITAAIENTAIGRRIADGLLARIFPPR